MPSTLAMEGEGTHGGQFESRLDLSAASARLAAIIEFSSSGGVKKYIVELTTMLCPRRAAATWTP